jgi:hypothetical protein
VIGLGEGAPQKIRVLQFFYRSVKVCTRDLLPPFLENEFLEEKKFAGSPEDHSVTRGFRTAHDDF